ncbi:hypothetical protein FOCC_FOCC015211 [Frankliniella occidentalis]|nr:hypothetical protein FOCC_FOCC015211 [Frankliniella occidentalis]
MHPLDVPLELQNLSYIEKQLISRVHPVISLYRIKKLEYKYKGQVINFTQNVQEVADKLPHLITDISNIVVVKLQSDVTLRDFVVRKDKVLEALLWLKKHNPFYHDVKIDESNLEKLPFDRCVYKELKMTISERDKSEQDEKDDKTTSQIDHFSDESCDDLDDTDSEDITFTSVPDSHNPTVLKSFTNQLVWPSVGTVPLNEFSSPGYMSMAFPHLFCFGTCDYSMPKKKKVLLSEYIRHLMLYKDGRFSSDERFRYFIMNSEMRWNALNIGNVYVKKNSIFSKMTVLQLKEYFKEHPSVVNQIMHFGSRLRTSKSYWNSRCSELLDMVNQIGTPTIFFTLSSADYYWPDLYRLLGHSVNDLSLRERGQLLAQNPLVVDSFFYMRSKYFLENCFKKHFEVTDMWYRYEFQHRGAIHLHGLAWFKNAPEVKEGMSKEEMADILKYYDEIISCENPDIHLIPLNQHPCEISLDKVEDKEKDLAHLINRVQRHTKCTAKHCLRPTGKNKVMECRYKFPKPLTSESTFELKDDFVVNINFKRNDVYVNKFNKWLLQTWRANIDFSPIITKEIVYRYIAKYAAKSEVKSVSYNHVLGEILNKTCDDSEYAKKAIRKLLISSCGERDYCSQEVMHFLMGYHFYHSSREFVVINLKNLDWTCLKGKYHIKNIFETYSNRSSTFQKLSLYDFSKYYKLQSTTFTLRLKPAVVRFFPRHPYNMDSVGFVQNLTILFYPWQSLDDVSVVNKEMETYVMSCYKSYEKRDLTNHLSNIYDSDDSESDDNNGNTDNDKSHQSLNKDEQSILSSYNPNSEHVSMIDLPLNNSHFVWDYLCVKLSKDAVFSVYEKLQKDNISEKHEKVDYKFLNKDQLRVFNHIKTLAHSFKTQKSFKSPFIIVQGMAGTGKTFLLKCCAQYIRSHLNNNAVKIIAPTGVAANIVNGSTIHSFLSLGRYTYKVERLTGVELLHFKEKHNGLKFIFLDEYSMVGMRMLACLDSRCRDFTGCESVFGNLAVVFFGDANQLLPVADQPLYSEITTLSSTNSLLERGTMLMSQLTHAYVLKQCHRFANQDYVSFLRKVSSGRCTEKERLSISRRFINELSSNEKRKFNSCIRICSTNESANDYNIQKLKLLRRPIANIKSENNCKTAFLSSDELADGLTNIITLSIGAKVMLRKNLNVNRGLVNGAIGILKHFLYEKGVKPPNLPVCVLVHFENVDVTDLNIKYIPICPVQSQWYKNGTPCTRFQLPLSLCWACTIHKAQGLSLLRVVLDAGDSEFALGLLYVALSRVPDFNSICLLTSLSLQRLNSCTSSSRFKMRRRFLKKLQQMSKSIRS